MKILNASYLCLIGAFMLALFGAWGAIVPQQLAASDTIGGWDCNSTVPHNCPGAGPACPRAYKICTSGDSGYCALDCYQIGEEIICMGACKYVDKDCTAYIIHNVCRIIV